MLNIKKLLTQMLKNTTYSIEQSTTTGATSISAGSTAWISVNMVKTGKKLLSPAGWYLQGSGNTNCVIYALLPTSTGVSMAIKNNGSTTTSLTIRVDGLYVAT